MTPGAAGIRPARRYRHGRGAEAPFARLRARLLAAVAGTRLYRLTLAAAAPPRLALSLPIRWPGDPARGAALLRGEFRLAGETIRDPTPFADPVGASDDWRREFHGFAWLADLAALDDAAARDAARAMIAAWLAAGDGWRPFAWRADVLGARLTAWITLFDVFFGPDQADAQRGPVLASLARQGRHLARVASWETAGAARLQALKGQIIAGLALGAGESRLARPVARLARELTAQILPDGGHVERSPAVQLAVLRDLIDIRTALRAAHMVVPEAVQMAIDRMAPMLRMLRHGDGRLVQFNDTAEAYGALADLALTRAEVRGRPLLSAPHSGFQRLQAGKTVLVADTGAPPPRGLDRHAHAGTLSFEMSYGRERLIVNCGAWQGTNPEWRRAARQTAAHSTVIVADTNSAELLPDGTIGRRPVVSLADRVEEEGSQWIAASHDGYAAGFGLVHTRQLFLSADGEHLRGEDGLAGRPGAAFVIRFHLHPAVQVSLVQEGEAALLRLPSGTGFRLRAQGAQLALAESVYLGGGEVRKTQQIVLSGHVGSQGATVRWAIRREGKKAAAA
ncbi:MAG TPA: heparinase II/III family protein [Stellaceae bacterium]|nr:heparinase II/III family protein [Stellaceae bacterium]